MDEVEKPDETTPKPAPAPAPVVEKRSWRRVFFLLGLWIVFAAGFAEGLKQAHYNVPGSAGPAQDAIAISPTRWQTPKEYLRALAAQEAGPDALESQLGGYKIRPPRRPPMAATVRPEVIEEKPGKEKAVVSAVTVHVGTSGEQAAPEPAAVAAPEKKESLTPADSDLATLEAFTAALKKLGAQQKVDVQKTAGTATQQPASVPGGLPIPQGAEN